MAKPLSNVILEAPGFFGLNTEDSPASMPPAFAKVADNCIVDNRGRIASRQGLEYVTTTNGTGTDIKTVYEFLKQDGTSVVLSAGDNKLFTGTTTLTDITASLTITADHWQMVTLADEVHMFQAEHEPLSYTAGGTLALHSTSGTGTAPEASCAVAGYGRIFAAGSAGSEHIVYWTDLLQGDSWTGGTSGSIDTREYWPQGFDTPVALAAHNGFLVIFGRRSILVYAGADSPSTMQLQDSIDGVGCIARDSVINMGSDLLFLDSTGYRSLGRTIQEKSSPIGSISRNVNTDLRSFVSNEVLPIKAVYDRKNSNVLLLLPSSQYAICFDTALPLEDGSYRATYWTGVKATSGLFARDETLLFGDVNGIKKYSDTYKDEGESYVMRYYAWSQDFGTPTTEKMAKGADITTDGGSGLVVAVKYAYDYSEAYRTIQKSLDVFSEAFFGIGEFGEAEYSSGQGTITRNHINLTGRGRSISLGLEANIDGDSLAIQEINIHSIVGRMI